MTRDIDIVIERVRALHPDARIEQLKVTHPTDDDGLWFFGLADGKEEVQVESSTGLAPFIIEHCDMKSSEEAVSGASIDRTISEVSAYLDALKKRANQSPQTTPRGCAPLRV